MAGITVSATIPNNSRKPLLEETASVAISLLAIVVAQIVVSGGRLLVALFPWIFVLTIVRVRLGSHDIDRALCRFWLRGQCAKGEQCEFLHHLPQHIDVQGLTAAMHRVDIVDDREPSDNPRNDFPTLSQAEMRNGRRGGGPFQSQVRPADPSRTRWATTVKKPIPQPPTVRPGNGSNAADDPMVRSINGPVARPSPRIRLRPPSLLPTLPTGDALNKLYMAYRSRAIELGATRNACLARAAECWRRGDGAGAKRHSREAHELNGKMGLEAGKAAARLVRERARVAVEAVRARDTSWSDDPGDRAAKGKTCGSDLGVCLGIAKVGIQHEKRLSPEERTECLLDLHGLHSNEAVEVVEDFLVAVSLFHLFLAFRGPFLCTQMLTLMLIPFSLKLSISSALPILSWVKKNTQVHRMQGEARLVLDWQLAFASGSLNGDIHGPNVTGSSASIHLLMRSEDINKVYIPFPQDWHAPLGYIHSLMFFLSLDTFIPQFNQLLAVFSFHFTSMWSHVCIGDPLDVLACSGDSKRPPCCPLLPCRSVSASPYRNSSIAAILSIAHRIIHIWNSNYHRLEDQAVCYFLTQTTACYCLYAPFFLSNLSLATPSSADFVLVIVLKEHLNGSSL
jgi:Domain of unknown function (DUF1771)/Torus domain